MYFHSYVYLFVNSYQSLALDPNVSAERPSELVQGKFPTMLFFYPTLHTA